MLTCGVFLIFFPGLSKRFEISLPTFKMMVSSTCVSPPWNKQLAPETRGLEDGFHERPIWKGAFTCCNTASEAASYRYLLPGEQSFRQRWRLMDALMCWYLRRHPPAIPAIFVETVKVVNLFSTLQPLGRRSWELMNSELLRSSRACPPFRVDFLWKWDKAENRNSQTSSNESLNKSDYQEPCWETKWAKFAEIR